MIWKCVDCGYESEERWLMCPECTPEAVWDEQLMAVRFHLEEIRGETA